MFNQITGNKEYAESNIDKYQDVLEDLKLSDNKKSVTTNKRINIYNKLNSSYNKYVYNSSISCIQNGKQNLYRIKIRFKKIRRNICRFII